MSAPLFSTPEDATRFASYASAFGNVDELLSSLQDGGITVGVDRRLRLMWLLAQVSQSGPPPDRGMLRALLIPALAKTSDEQVEIATLVDQWFARNAEVTPTASGLLVDPEKRPSDSAGVVFGLDRWWVGVVIAGVVVAFLAFIAMLIFRYIPGASPGDVPPPIPLPRATVPDAALRALLEDVLSRLAFAAAVLVCGFALFTLRTQAKARLTRRIGETDLVEVFKFQEPLPAWFRSGMARRFFDQLKRSRWFEINQIDARKSVAATVRAGGIPKIARMLVRERPQYVLFMDRGGDWDHSDLLAKTLEAAIAGADIVFTRYDYVDRPTRLSQVRDGVRQIELLPLSVIGSRHAGERLIIVGRGSEFFQTPGHRRDRSGREFVVRPGTPVPELLHLREFSVSFILTPTPRQMWGQTERHLSDLGLILATADVGGIAEIAAWLTREPDQSARPGAAVADPPVVDNFIGRLSREAGAFSSDIPPSLDEIERLLAELRSWVDDRELYTLIVALGVFQKVDPAFTQLLAHLLLPSRDGILDLPTFSKLLQLPWLRDGRFPEWLRIALANSLDPNDLREVRRVQLCILDRLDAKDEDQAVANLDALVSSFEVARDLTDKQVEELASRVDGGGLLDADERVFVSLLKGTKLHPVDDVLRPEAPAAMREKMEAPERRRQRTLVSSILGLALIAGIVQPWITAAFFSLMTALQPLVSASQKAIVNFLPIWPGLALRAITTLGTISAAAIWLRASFRSDAKPAWASAWLAWIGFGSALLALPFGGLSDKNSELSAAWMPLLSGLAVLLWVSRVSFASWWRSPDFDDLWLERLRRDDWLATTLGALLIGLIFTVPLCTIVFPEITTVEAHPSSLLTAVLLGGIGWAAANALLRRFLLGDASAPLPGRPWLDLAYGTIFFLMAAAFSRATNSLVAGLAPKELLTVPTMAGICLLALPIAWWVAARAVLGLRSGTGSFARALRSFVLALFAFVLTFIGALRLIDTFTTAVEPIAKIIIDLLGIEARKNDVAGVLVFGLMSIVPMQIYLVMIVRWAYLIGHVQTAMLARVRILYELISRTALIQLLALQIIWIAVFAIPPKALLESPLLAFFVVDGNTDVPVLVMFLTWLLLIPPILVFWPLLRFAGLTESERKQVGTTNLTPWLGAAIILLFSMTWKIGDGLFSPPPFKTEDGLFSLAPLVLPVAIFLAWRWGERATVPILVGTLPFALSIGGPGVASTPGGIWPMLAILFWCRFVCDAALRAQLLRREHLGWAEVGLIVLLLSHGGGVEAGKIIGQDASLVLNPDWMIATVAVVVGASRMPKGRLALGFVVAGLVHLASGLFIDPNFTLKAFAMAPGYLGLKPHEVFMALLALYSVPAYFSPQTPGAWSRKLRERVANIGAKEVTVHFANPLRRFLVPDRMIFGALFGLGATMLITQANVDILTYAGEIDQVRKGMVFENGRPGFLLGPDFISAMLLAWGAAVASSEKSRFLPSFLIAAIPAFTVAISGFFLTNHFDLQIGPGSVGADYDVLLTRGTPPFYALLICAAGFFLFGKLLPIAAREGPQTFSWMSIFAPLFSALSAIRVLLTGGESSREAVDAGEPPSSDEYSSRKMRK